MNAPYAPVLSADNGSLIDLIGSIMELRDPYTNGHEKRVAQIAVTIARQIGLNDDFMEALYIAGCLHDIGKMAVPLEILIKPTSLTRPERDQLCMHCEVGYKLLKPLNFKHPV